MNRTITIPDLNFNIIPLSENYIIRHDHSFDLFAGSGEDSIASSEFHQELYSLTCYSSNLLFQSDIFPLDNSLLFPYNVLLLPSNGLLHLNTRMVQVHNSMLHENIRMMHEHNRMLHEHNRMMYEHNRMMHEHNRMMHEHNRMMHEHIRMLNFFNRAFLFAKSKCFGYMKKLSILLNDNVLNTVKHNFSFILQWKFNLFSVSKPDLSPVDYCFNFLQCRCRSYLHIVTTYKIYIGESINISVMYFISSLNQLKW